MAGKKQTARAARDLFRLCLVGGALDEARGRDVAARLAASKRRGALGVLASFLRLVRLDRDRHTALVESAMPLDDGLRERIRQRLAGAYGPRVGAAFEENPSLIGGVRIRIGSVVYDGSVRARLAALAGRLWL